MALMVQTKKEGGMLQGYDRHTSGVLRLEEDFFRQRSGAEERKQHGEGCGSSRITGWSGTLRKVLEGSLQEVGVGAERQEKRVIPDHGGLECWAREVGLDPESGQESLDV